MGRKMKGDELLDVYYGITLSASQSLQFKRLLELKAEKTGKKPKAATVIRELIVAACTKARV